jgi:hypothetical protein
MGDFTEREDVGLIEQGGEVFRRYGVRFPDGRIRLVAPTFGEAKAFVDERRAYGAAEGGYAVVRQIIMYSNWAET